MSNQMKEIDWSKAPEGTTHFRHDDPQCSWRMLKDGVWHAWFGGKWMTVTGSAEHLYVERPTWSGEGLPPVGTVCEISNPQQIDEWCECTVLAHDRSLAVFRASGDYPWLYDGAESGSFRPIRTPEQIAAEERLHKVRNACTAIADTLDSLRGKTKVERAALAVVEAMIDAGYTRVDP